MITGLESLVAVWYLLLSIWFQNAEFLMDKRLADLKDECRKSGQLVGTEDIQKDYQANLGKKDVTKEFYGLAKKITEHKKFRSFDRTLRQFDRVTEDQWKVPSESLQKKFREKLSLFSDEIQQIEKLFADPGNYLDLIQSVGFENCHQKELKDIYSVGAVLRILESRARLFGVEGESEQMVRSLETMVRIGREMNRFPFPLTVQVELASESIAATSLSYCLQFVRLSGPQIERLKKLFPLGPREKWGQTIQYQRYFFDQVATDKKALKQIAGMSLPGRFRLVRRSRHKITFPKADRLIVYDHMTENLKLSKRGWKNLERIRGELIRRRNRLCLPYNAIEYTYGRLQADVMKFPLERYADVEAFFYSSYIEKASRNCNVHVCLDVYQYYLRNGKYPEELSKVYGSRTAPIDPADGKLVRGRREGDTYLVWCCGYNGKNNNGNILNDYKKEEEKFSIGKDAGYRLDFSKVPSGNR